MDEAETTPLYLRFPDRATALAVAAGLVGHAVEDLPSDGWYAGTYFCIDVLFGNGVVMRPAGAADADGQPLLEPAPGFHVNGLWRGPADTVPAELAAYRIEPSNPAVVWG